MEDGAKLPAVKKQASQVVLSGHVSPKLKPRRNSLHPLHLSRILALNVCRRGSVLNIGISAFLDSI